VKPGRILLRISAICTYTQNETACRVGIFVCHSLSTNANAIAGQPEEQSM